MKTGWPFFLILLTACSCSSPWLDTGNGKINYEKYLITNAVIIKSINSESGALLNLMSYSGYSINERDIIGASGIGFSIQEGEFPIIDCNYPDMHKTFLTGAGIAFHEVVPPDPRSSWEGVKKLLSSGIPVALRVDTRYLSYRFDGKEGPAFASDGRHYVTILGIDTYSDLAWVADSPYKELKEISIEDLDMARSSRLKIFPPQRSYYWIGKKDPSYLYNWKQAVKTALSESIRNMESPQKGNGISALIKLPADIFDFEKRVRFYGFLQIVFNNIYHDIALKDNDGFAFRIFFRNFLREAFIHTYDRNLNPIIAELGDSALSWQDFSQECLKISVNVKEFKNIDERKIMYRKARVLAGAVAEKEKKLLAVMKGYLAGAD